MPSTIHFVGLKLLLVNILWFKVVTLLEAFRCKKTHDFVCAEVENALCS
jgi:hypothetical protein